MLAPQAPDALLVDPLFSAYQRADPTVAIAGMALHQLLDLAQQRVIIGRVGLIAEGRAMDGDELAGTVDGQPARHQEVDRFALLRHGQTFFPSSSLSRSISKTRSASSRLRRVFSFSSSFRRWASLTDIPP